MDSLQQPFRRREDAAARPPAVSPEDADPQLASPEAEDFYRSVLRALDDAGIEYLVGGAYAFVRYTAIDRRTKDFDIFVRREDMERAFDVLRSSGFATDFTFPHWLGKVLYGEHFVDIIYSSGNGVAPVDDGWFLRAPEGEVFGVPVRLVPPEEMLWSKAFVMERERYDGNDVLHILRAMSEKLEWDHLIDRFGARWRVLLSYLILFGFVYPGERARIPQRVMEQLMRLVMGELTSNAPVRKLCNGSVLSRQQFLIDIDEWGYLDGRLEPRGNMSADEIAHWTAAIEKK